MEMQALRIIDALLALFWLGVLVHALRTGFIGPRGVHLQTRRTRPVLFWFMIFIYVLMVVHFGGLDWRSIGGVGYKELHQEENDTGPDDCNHAQYGAFILAAPNCPLSGELEGVHLLDMAPTLLELGGYDVPPSMQGRSLFEGAAVGLPESALSLSDEELVRQRLSGLGYI